MWRKLVKEALLRKDFFLAAGELQATNIRVTPVLQSHVSVSTNGAKAKGTS